MTDVYCKSKICLDKKQSGLCQANRIEIERCKDCIGSQKGMQPETSTNLERKHGALTQKPGAVLK